MKFEYYIILNEKIIAAFNDRKEAFKYYATCNKEAILINGVYYENRNKNI